MDNSQLATALRSAVAALHKGLRKQSYSMASLSMTEMETIGLLSRNDALLPTELAALTRVKTQSMSQIIKKLEGEGIVKRTPSKEDRRKVYISLTATGRKLVEKARYDRDEWLKESIEKNLSNTEKEQLAKAVVLLTKLIEIK